MNQIEPNPPIATPPGDVGTLPAYLNSLTAKLSAWLVTLAIRVNGAMPRDGSEAMSGALTVGGPLTLATYTTGTLPAVTTPALVFVSDAADHNRFQAWDPTAAAWRVLG